MRLIDADALMDKITSETIFIKDGLWVSKIIDDAPTIEPSGDLISRADAIEAVMNTEPVVFDSQSLEPHQKTKDVIDALSALPSAEAVSREDYHNLLTASNDIDRALREYQAKEEHASADDTFCKSQLITCNRVKECNGVCPFEDALKHADKEMDEQTVINHDRDWIIGCIEHDGFIHTHRFDKANQIIHDALSAEVQGEWQMCEDFDGEYGICSVCGEDADFSHYGAPYNFCPNCGARMKGGDDTTGESL